MIRYSLRCASGHVFDSWFADAAAYDALAAAKHLACPECGSHQVEKALMVPSVRPARKVEARNALPEPAAAASAAPAQKPASPPAGPATAEPPAALQARMEEAIAAIRREVEENSDYVGQEFASEARRMHEGEAPARAIYGEVRPDEAKALVEEGVPVLPLPFTPRRKLN